MSSGALTGMNRIRVRSPSGEAEVRRRKRSVVQLAGILNCVSGCNPLRYRGYGCFCGYRGDGTPVDPIDSCCLQHDWCYSQSPCSKLSIYLLPYDWICITRGIAHCAYPSSLSPHAHCGQQLCQCDLQFANCVSRYPCPNRRVPCRHTKLSRFQNILHGKRKPLASHAGDDKDVYANGVVVSPGVPNADYSYFKKRTKTRLKGHGNHRQPLLVKTTPRSTTVSTNEATDQEPVDADLQHRIELTTPGNVSETTATDKMGERVTTVGSQEENIPEGRSSINESTLVPEVIDNATLAAAGITDDGSEGYVQQQAYATSVNSTEVSVPVGSASEKPSTDDVNITAMSSSLVPHVLGSTTPIPLKTVRDFTAPLPSMTFRHRQHPGSESRRSTELMLHPNSQSVQRAPRLKIEVHLQPKPHPYRRPYLRFEVRRRPNRPRRRSGITI
ncbi:uncharacterized protein LOC135384135 [Ornithodoros turicata]|uniref:uncharacterized protein LOC135384135 n=1 Tax=Ornithodoros turicata TaxID=34597 RepID=UPI0031398682